MALLFAHEGADVAVADLGGQGAAAVGTPASREQLEQTADEVRALGHRAVAIAADVTKAADTERMARTVLDALGRIDVLCANAGIFSFGRAWELTEEAWDAVIAVNLKGVWLTTKAVVPHMIERRAGKILITSSRDGLRAEPNYAHYNASKFGVIGYMKSLAIELGPYAINVNCICPTQMADKSRTPPPARPNPYWQMVTGLENPTYEEFDAASGRENLFEEGGQPDFTEIAQVALWLVSDRAFPVTGHALPADRGWIAKRGG